MPAFEERLSPSVQIGDNLELIPEDHPKRGFYRVEYIEQIHPIDYDFGSIAAETEGTDTEIDDLYVNDLELAEYVVYLIDDLELTVKQPFAKTRFKTKGKVTPITKLAPQLDPYLSRNRVFVIEDEKIYFLPKNPTKYGRPSNKVRFQGWRYILTKLVEKPEKYARIPVGAR